MFAALQMGCTASVYILTRPSTIPLSAVKLNGAALIVKHQQRHGHYLTRPTTFKQPPLQESLIVL